MRPHPTLSQRERVTKSKCKDAGSPIRSGMTARGGPHPDHASGHAGQALRNHDHALHAAVAFDGTSKVIDARRQRQVEFEPLAGSQGHPLLERAGLRTGFRHDLDTGLSGKGSLKPVCFPALISHHKVQRLPCLHIDPRRCESKIVDDDGYVLIFGGTGSKAQ